VPFFRGRQPETSVWRRFRSGRDGFTFVREADYYAAHVVTNAERGVDLFHVLLEHFPPAVDVTVDDRRRQRTWAGTAVALPDVQEAIGRIKSLLAAAAGAEIAVYTTDDQITINPQLELFIYGRSDRWLYLLLGLGLEERRVVPTRSWKLSRHEFDPAPELTEALDATVSRLGLAPA
jgi:hypothetical protein